MSDFPQFENPVALSATRSWVAEFESFDQRKGSVYYFVTVYGGAKGEKSFFIEVDLSLHYNSSDAERDSEIGSRLQAGAKKGHANTKYEGSMLWKLSRGESGEL